jgi:hypothetical protein
MSDHKIHEAKDVANVQENFLNTSMSKYPKSYQDDLIRFSSPANPTQEEESIIADIVNLDHRSVHALKPNTLEREEVKWLLINAASCIQSRETLAASSLNKKAEQLFDQYLQAKNRIKYLLGMVIGVMVSIGIAILLMQSSPYFLVAITGNILGSIFLFAGIGSITSVLTRLSDIDLRQQISNSLIFISGATRPVVAIFFAMIVFLILKMKIIDIHFGSDSASPDGIYLVTSFLCGFSERFASDIISRVNILPSENSTNQMQAR